MFKYTIEEIPPSNNKYMGSGKMGANYQYQAEKKRWARDIKVIVGKDKPKNPIEKSIVTIRYYFKTKHRRDPDNYSGKFILDGLVQAGVIEDDSFNNIELVIKGGHDKGNPRTEITIQEVAHGS